VRRKLKANNVYDNTNRNVSGHDYGYSRFSDTISGLYSHGAMIDVMRTRADPYYCLDGFLHDVRE
jgi:hypothetical protein